MEPYLYHSSKPGRSLMRYGQEGKTLPDSKANLMPTVCLFFVNFAFCVGVYELCPFFVSACRGKIAFTLETTRDVKSTLCTMFLLSSWNSRGAKPLINILTDNYGVGYTKTDIRAYYFFMYIYVWILLFKTYAIARLVTRSSKMTIPAPCFAAFSFAQYK